MAASILPSGEITTRPSPWRYAGFRLATLLVECGLAAATLSVIDRLSPPARAASHPRLLDLAVIAAVLFVLDVLFALRNLNRATIRLSRLGISAATGLGGETIILWHDLDWPRTQGRGAFDKSLGQRVIWSKGGQRILWRQVTFDPVDVRMILEQMTRWSG